jgi:hypothetical protein
MDVLGTLKEVSELVKKYNDIELMKQIVQLQSQVFELQQTNLRLNEELAQERRQSATESAMEMRGPMNYYFRQGDPVPFCPKCWEDQPRKAIHLPEAEPWSGGIRRDCRVCNETYWEKPVDMRNPSTYDPYDSLR